MTAWTERLTAVVDAFVRTYNRHETTLAAAIPDEPVLLVANHGFGGVFDLNIIAFSLAHKESGDTRPVIALTHQVAWQIGVGKYLEPFGARYGSRETALEALAEGTHVLVFPGGDIDAFKSWKDRNTVEFAGRSGFARLAIEAGVPIVPVVTSGAGESVIVVDDGEWLARATGAHQRFRLRRLPVSLSIPWGLNLGLVGLLPYFPLPTKLRTTVLPAMQQASDESADDYAQRVHSIMQAELDRQTVGRTPLLG